MEKHFYNQGDLIQYRDSQGDLEVGVITRVFQVARMRDLQQHRYAVTWTNHNGWGLVGISETYSEEFYTNDIDENEHVTLLARG